jgi:hypothetical protein
VVGAYGLTQDELQELDLSKTLLQDVSFGSRVSKVVINAPIFLDVDSARSMLASLCEVLGKRSLEQLVLNTSVPTSADDALKDLDVKDLQLVVYKPAASTAGAAWAPAWHPRLPARVQGLLIEAARRDQISGHSTQASPHVQLDVLGFESLADLKRLTLGTLALVNAPDLKSLTKLEDLIVSQHCNLGLDFRPAGQGSGASGAAEGAASARHAAGRRTVVRPE